MDETGAQEDFNPLRRFGADVRRLRAGRGLTQRHLARGVGYSEAYVSMVESGKTLPSPRFATGCDRVFDTHGLFAGMLKRVVEGGADHPAWFVPYLTMERKAAGILDFSVNSIMGLLQTEEYARAIFRAGFPRATPESIRGKVDARLRRREVMARACPPALWVVLHEACLRTVVGGPAVMAGQLTQLAEAAGSPDIDLQVLPFSAGAVAAHLGPFTLLTLNDGQTVLYEDSPQGGRLYDKLSIVAGATRHYDRLRAQALSLEDSLALINTLGKEFSSCAERRT